MPVNDLLTTLKAFITQFVVAVWNMNLAHTTSIEGRYPDQLQRRKHTECNTRKTLASVVQGANIGRGGKCPIPRPRCKRCKNICTIDRR